MDAVQSLFEAVREACTGSAWSRGVELARADAVRGERDEGDEVELRVSTRGGLVSPRVTLHPGSDDWECECGSRDAVCEHVAAAAIALRRARQEGASLPGAAGEARGRIGYRLSRTRHRGLALERVVVTGEGEQATEALLRSTLAAVSSGRVEGPAFMATSADLDVERALGTRLRGELPRGILAKLLAALSGCPDVTLDGRPVRARAERVGLRAALDDADGGFRLSVARDASVEETFDETVARCGDVLRPLGETRLTGRELADLPGGRFYPADAVAELVTEVLPSLEKRMPIDVRTRRLPRTERVPPRIALQVERRGDALSVLPTLVYGDPAVARVDAGRLVPLGSGPVPLRDDDAERHLTRRLQNELELLPGRRADVTGEVAIALADRIARWDGPVRGRSHEEFFLAPPLVPHLEAFASGFDLRFAPEPSDEPRRPGAADAARVLRAWREGASLVPLAGGGFAPLPADWLERFGERIADLLAARAQDGALPRCALPDLARLCDELDVEAPPDVAPLAALLEGSEGIPRAERPADLAADLRPYQQRGVDWLCCLRDAALGALLADDMGLGKTLQALCALRGPALVVAPTSVVPNWAEEVARFRPALRACVYHGPDRALAPDADVTLTTYALLRLDADRLADVAWKTVVLDEAQAIKNPDSQVARAAYRLRGDFRMALTGTPVENRLDELWSQLHFANPGLLGGRRNFEARYAKPIAEGDAATAARLRERIRPFVLRRRKAEVAPELPPRTDVVLHAELEPAERAIYDAVLAATRREVAERLEARGSALEVLEALLRLRQAACHPALVPGQTGETSSKVELLLENLDEAAAEGHRALVFSQWTSLLDLVEPHLRRAGLGFLRLDGATRDRAGVVARFQAPDGPPVLLSSLRAGGVGLNLTAADCVFLLDPWWNPAAEDQAADRAHRIGQDRPVMVYRLVSRDTVEERILALQGRKRDLADAALSDAGRASSITREDLLELLA